MKRFYFEEEGIHTQEFHVPLYRRASAQDVFFIGFGLFVLSYLIVFYLISVTNIFIKNPMEINISAMFQSPSFDHLFGTDFLGRDIFSRIAKGTEAFFLPGLLSITISTACGVLFGVLSGMYPRFASKIISYVLDIVDSIPRLIFILIIIVLFRPSIYLIMTFVGVTSIPKITAYVKAKVQVLKKQGFIESSRALGLAPTAIIFKHIVWFSLKSVLVIHATLGLGEAILIETSLSYLGIGVQEPIPSWGNMVAMGADYFFQGRVWLSSIPAITITVTIMGLYLLGDGLNAIYNEKVTR